MSQLVPSYTLIGEGLCQGRVIAFLRSGASLGGRNPHLQPWSVDDPACLLRTPCSVRLGHRVAWWAREPGQRLCCWRVSASDGRCGAVCVLGGSHADH